MRKQRTPIYADSREERDDLVIILKNRYAARHPWAHSFRKWPIVGHFYRWARTRFIEEQLGS